MGVERWVNTVVPWIHNGQKPTVWTDGRSSQVWTSHIHTVLSAQRGHQEAAGSGQPPRIRLVARVGKVEQVLQERRPERQAGAARSSQENV